MTEPPAALAGMAAIQRADDVPPAARLAAALLYSAIRDARGCDVHAARARAWLVTHGADWLDIILDGAADPRAVLARELAGEDWFARTHARTRGCIAGSGALIERLGGRDSD